MNNLSALGVLLGSLVFATGSVSAQTIDLYDGDDSGIFKYLDFSPSGVVTSSGSTMVIAADKDSDGKMGLFGILGRDVDNAPVEVEAASHRLRIEFKFSDGNEADQFNLVLTDMDEKGGGEQFKFAVTPDAEGAVETTDGFRELILPITERDAGSRTTGSDAGFSDDGDGVANYGLTQWQIQSVYGSNGALMVEIRSLQIVPSEPD